MLIHQEDITIISICAPKIVAPKQIMFTDIKCYRYQVLTDIKVEIDSKTIIVGD